MWNTSWPTLFCHVPEAGGANHGVERTGWAPGAVRSVEVRMIRGCESVCGCDMKSVTLALTMAVAKFYHVNISRFVTRRDDRMTMMC